MECYRNYTALRGQILDDIIDAADKNILMRRCELGLTNLEKHTLFS